MLTRKRTASLALLVAAAAAVTALHATKKTNPPQLDDTHRIVHALNRLTFGPAPGDIDRVKAIGLDKWIDEQLHPDKIDDSALDARLSNFLTLKMSAHDMAEHFPPNQLIKQVADGKISIPRNPDEKLVYLAELQRYQFKLEKKNSKGKPDDTNDADNSASDADNPERREMREHGRQVAFQIAALKPDDRIPAMLRLNDDDRRSLLLIGDPARNQLTDGMNPADREAVLALRNPAALVHDELTQAKLLRAIYSNRQFEEVMTDFWFNHFNIYVNKGPDRYFVTEYERDVIRPHALGKFKDLLKATAHSPAMLFYLDNAESVGPNSLAATGPPPFRGGFGRPAQQQKKKQSGLNENYARELMELHTLGVNGGYTQKDVSEVAKVFTGWTIEEPYRGGNFRFVERRHEPGPKHVLGQRIDEEGEREGDHVLEMLARDPHTAHFVCNKLAMRFVSDDPPPALVDRMANTYLQKDGDIREILKTMLKSPEFWTPESYRAKVKTPLEFVVSAARATGADVTDARPLVQTLNQMGMPLYGMQPPTGYSMKAETWVNSAALLARMNFAFSLGGGHLNGTQIAPELLLGQNEPADQTIAEATLENDLLAGDVSEQTRTVIQKQFNDPKVLAQASDDPQRAKREAVLEGLILGSPEFQRR
jgi:uncharacterized protein (DUF1800 family)